MKYILKLIVGLSLLITSATHAQHDTMGKQIVDMLVSPYLQIQQGLAGDDLSAAKAGAKELLKAVSLNHQDGDTKQDLDGLSKSASGIAGASGISSAREEFQILSLRMESLLKRLGTSGNTVLYVAKCPMAFGGKGGTWIQQEKQITNPYFGAQMFHCGGIQEEIRK